MSSKTPGRDFEDRLSLAHFLEGGDILENDIFRGHPVMEAPQMDFGQHQWTKAKAFGQFADQLPHVA